MLTPDALEKIALDFAKAGMNSLLQPPFEVQTTGSENEWDPALHRHVFTQSHVVWRPFDQITIQLGADGRVVTFRDENRFENATYERLPDEAILSICRTTGVIGPLAAVSAVSQGPGGTLVAEVIEPFPNRRRTLRFTINTTARQVAAFETPVP